MLYCGQTYIGMWSAFQRYESHPVTTFRTKSKRKQDVKDRFCIQATTCTTNNVSRIVIQVVNCDPTPNYPHMNPLLSFSPAVLLLYSSLDLGYLCRFYICHIWVNILT